MKYGIINTLMMLSIITLVNCKENKTNSGQNTMTNIEQVQSVKVVSAGGALGFSSSTVIDKDSIHYNRTVAANEADNLIYNRKMKPEDWERLADKIDIKIFGAATEGKSVQPVDGIDTKIIITTSAGNISKMNAYDNPVWKRIRDEVDQYK
ncbi:hypothetical protein [Chryseobacterium contaminans]|uniref:hypothetical protein n=1 Tax=Chryseobacterium contaminans TaxID=1423959 RepID=UPI0030161168